MQRSTTSAATIINQYLYATSRRAIHRSTPAFTSSKGQGRGQEEEGSVTEDIKGKKATKPYNETTQATSASTDEIKETDTAFDPSTVDPKNEMKEMSKETEDKKSPLDWSGANERASPQTKKRES
ncbi:hypothetical protein BDB00DRAFT_877476 [Zychaea mexicana]|uniref:uncharacterized protein n=1 Tax=Zychaea mexicana TaxID=64656 RepID=UPI0022FE8E22|nr:uncharacterized protein BDB00DRAFT_877476 [Zychaea mexicana]KAI9488413.1 hypothetical protein BDB00DRAFT_877476 [Zychaea mexicana]